MANSAPVLGLHDVPMWRSMDNGYIRLQCCVACEALRYPPASHCPECLGEEAAWREIVGYGTILSWVVFHKEYFPDHPPPYNSIAVRLEEGPIVITQLRGKYPTDSWIGHRVVLGIEDFNGRNQHFASLCDD